MAAIESEARTLAARAFAWQALAGRFVELSGAGASAVLTVALQLAWEAQHAGENVAWIGVGGSVFFAPDAARAGIDLAALPVVMAPDALTAGRAASHLLRSGAFGLVVLDLAAVAARDAELPLPLQSRLTGLVQKHGSVLVVLSSKDSDQPSLGSLVSLHATVRREGRAAIVHIRKDKRHGPGWSQRTVCDGPLGWESGGGA